MEQLRDLDVQKIARDNPLVDEEAIKKLVASDFEGLGVERVGMINFNLSLPYSDAPEVSCQSRNEKW